MRRGRRYHPDEFFRRFGPRRRRPNPLLVVWRWRRELALMFGLPWVVGAVAAAAGPVVAALPLLAGAVVLGAWRPGRLMLTAYLRGVVTEHRLRVGMVQAGVVSWSGWIPAVLHTRRHRRGVRILLWCPAGVDVNAFRETSDLLAAACWASDVEVARHPRWAQVVVLLAVR